MVKSPSPWTNAPSIYKNIQTRLHSFFIVVVEQTVTISARVSSPPFLAKYLFFVSKPLSLLLSGLAPLCNFCVPNIDMTASSWQMKQSIYTASTYTVNAGQDIFDETRGKKSIPKYWFLHRQISTEWIVLADNSKKIKRTEVNLSENKLFYVCYFSTNAFLSTAYSLVTSTDPCNNTPISIQLLKASLHNFSTLNFKRKRKKRRKAAMRGGCAQTALYEEALFSVSTERSDKQTTLKIQHKHSLAQLHVLAILQPYNFCPQGSLQWYMEGHRKLMSLTGST